MKSNPSWAPHWTGVDQGNGKIVRRQTDPNRDEYWADFENQGATKRVRVRIAFLELREFSGYPADNAPSADKGVFTEQVLRAILQRYAEQVGEPPSDIDAKDLGTGLSDLKAVFRLKKSNKTNAQ